MRIVPLEKSLSSAVSTIEALVWLAQQNNGLKRDNIQGWPPIVLPKSSHTAPTYFWLVEATFPDLTNDPKVAILDSGMDANYLID